MKRTGFTSKRKPMRKVSAKRSSYRRSDEGKAAMAYMGAVKALPCCICGAPPPSIAHHCIHGRFSARKASDLDTIPLCSAHHDYPQPDAIHSGKETWAAKYGPDTDYIEKTRRTINHRKE